MSTSGERKQAIAEGAIRIVARDGLRALTHRAVDREAQIPQGSTSHYANSRAALLELIVETLTTRSHRDTDSVAVVLRSPGNQSLTPERFADIIADLVDTLASRGDDMKARYALMLELDAESPLRAKLTDDSQVHTETRAIVAEAFGRMGISVTANRVDDLVALTEAELFHRTVLGRRALDDVLRDYLKRLQA